MKNLYLFFFTLLCSASFAQNKYIDSLKMLTSSKVDTVRFWAYSELVWELKDKDTKSAIKYSTDLLTESKKTDNLKWIAQGYNDLGIVYYRGGNLKLALENFEPSLAIRKKLGNKKDIASSLSKIAIVKAENKEYNKALTLQLEVLKIYEDLNILPYIAQTCNNIGQLCNYTKNFLLVRKYLSRAYIIGEKLNDANTMSLTMFSLASNYYNLKKIDSAIICYSIAKEKFKIAKNLRGYATSCSNLGQMYKEQGKNKEALSAYKEAIEISKSINDSSSLASFESHYADFLITEKRFAEAEKILLNALAISKKLGHGNIEVNNYQQLTSLYIQMKNPQQAEFYFKKYQVNKDSIFSKENAKQFSEMQIKYETEKKDRQISDLNKDNELKTATIERNTILVGALVLVLILSVFIFYLWRKRQLYEAQHTLQKDRLRISRDLHDNIGSYLTFINSTINSSNPEMELLKQTTTESIDELRRTVWLINKASVSLEEWVIKLREYHSKIKNVIVESSLRNSTVTLSAVQATGLFRIVQEAVNNAVKYAAAEKIVITVSQTENKFHIAIQDNGNGFDVATIKNGFGLNNMKERAHELNGTCNITTSPGKGVCIDVSVPITV